MSGKDTCRVLATYAGQLRSLIQTDANCQVVTVEQENTERAKRIASEDDVVLKGYSCIVSVQNTALIYSCF